jgi:hypothetical protein
MENYSEYFNGKEELLEKLEKLHNRKNKLKSMLSKSSTSSYVVELCGLPRTGKTVACEKIYNFFKYGDISISKAEEPAFLVKSNLTYNQLINMGNLEFNDKTLEVSKQNLEELKRKKSSIILMDRGIIDNYFWYQMMYNEGTISEDVYNDRMSNLFSDLKEVDNLNVMFANPKTVITRDYINQIYLEDRTKTTLDKVTKLQDSYEYLLSFIDRKDNEKFSINTIDTTNISETETSILLANNIIDGIEKKLILEKED